MRLNQVFNILCLGSLCTLSFSINEKVAVQHTWRRHTWRRHTNTQGGKRAAFKGINNELIIYPEWPHRQGGCLACWSCKVDFLRLHWFTLCTRHSGGTADEVGRCNQSTGSTVTDAIVSSWLWSTETRSSSLGYFSRLLQVVDN